MDMIRVDDRDDFIVEADRFLTQGLYEKALSLSRERLRICPGDAEAMIIICQSWLGLGDLEEAKAGFAALEKMYVRLARAYQSMGDAYLKTGRRQEAVACFQKGMLLLPEAFEDRQLSQMMGDMIDVVDKNIPQAPVVDETPAVNPDFFTMTMADLYEKQGHLEMAAEVLEAINRREPGNEAVVERLHEVTVRMKGQPEAVSEDREPALVSELSRWLRNVNRLRSSDPKADRHA